MKSVADIAIVVAMCMNTTDAKSVRVNVIYLLTVEIDS